MSGLLDWVDPAREWWKSRPEVVRGLLSGAYSMATDQATREAAMARLPKPFDRSVTGEQMMDNALNAGPSGLLGTSYKYAPKYRPPTAANMPSGISGIEPPNNQFKFGTVTYERPLSSREIESFELSPLDPKHPINIKADFGKWKDSFMNNFSESGAYEIKNKSGKRIGLVSEDARGDAPFRVTMLDGDKPTGHLTFSDFDELSREVWGMTKWK